ncbi:hypothetical protein [Bartonella sp. DGB2]|uniref:phage adaptor protein n=1 Tax=Bartonella sp. DGB2 TaxID=3388426 RepID=UPI00398FB038
MTENIPRPPSSNLKDPYLEFKDLINILKDEIDDINGNYEKQIERYISDAIRFCAREPFYFNESRDVFFIAYPGQDWYGRIDEPNIADAVAITHLYLQTSQGNHLLDHKTNEELELLGDSNPYIGPHPANQKGAPRAYCVFNQKIRLYPTPDTYYRIRLVMAPRRFTVTNSAIASPWLTEASGLIKARAKYEIYKNIFKDPDLAASAYSDFQEELKALIQETSRRKGRESITPTLF